jgi:hypothetical protein
VATRSSADGKPHAPRSLRDHPLAKVAAVVGVLVAAFLFTRSCGSDDVRISDDKAIAIAREEIDYAPDRVQVRLIRRGVQARPYWAVSLQTLGPDDRPERVTVVVVDARTEAVAEVRTSGG